MLPLALLIPFVAFAPGRVEIVGNHTDYTGGNVIAMALEESGDKIGVTIELIPNVDPGDLKVTVNSEALQKDGTYKALHDEYMLGQEVKRGSWIDYFQGVSDVLLKEHFEISRGYTLNVKSQIPGGGGLSSSAALEIAQFRAIRHVYGLQDLDDVRVAKLGQRVENKFVGSNTGLMDQLTISLSDESRSMLFMNFADPSNPIFERILLPDGVGFVVFNSGVKHDLSSDEGENYNKRRKETDAALKSINESRRQSGKPEFRSLGELKPADLAESYVTRLPDKQFRRVRHLVTENDRVFGFRDAIRATRWVDAGKILSASHRSSRDDYEVCAPEVDRAVTIALSDPDVIGARMVGGGFGGPMLAMVKKGTEGKVALMIQAEYQRAMLLMHPDPAHRPIGEVQVGLGGHTSLKKCMEEKLSSP